MKMSEVKYGITKKNVIFKETDKRHAELKIRLNYDNLKITEFFQMIVSSYLRGDTRIVEIIDEHKESVGANEKTQRKINKDLVKRGNFSKSKFGLDEGEVESIFDILEKEHPDL